MGVVIHILDRRAVRLDVGGVSQDVGALRRLSKITELDDQREAARESAALMPSPPAALLAEAVTFPLASSAGGSVAAHLVIGWDEGRGSVSDLVWDYLPTLGYAVRDRPRDVFVLHEMRDGELRMIDADRAEELGLIVGGSLARRGQPVISECHAVRPYITGFAEADCVLEDGRRERLLIRIAGDILPDPLWLVGRRPMDVEGNGS